MTKDKTFPEEIIVEEEKDEDGTIGTLAEKTALDAIFKAADYVNDDDIHKNVEIARGGRVILSFRIRPLSEQEWFESRDRNTKKKRNKQTGLIVSEDLDYVRHRSHIIYLATVEEDRKKLWDNREAWPRFGIITGVDMIDKVLLAGEKQQVFHLIDEISGYKDDEDSQELEIVEESKN